MRFQKKILKVGDTYYAHGGEVKVTHARHKHWVEQFNALKAAGYKAPAGWGHGDDDKPVKFSSDHHDERDTAGYAIGLKQDGDYLVLELDIPDPEDARKVEQNLAHISPVIYDQWQDGKNNHYRDIFTHFDLVQHPVDHSQTKFIALSLVTTKSGAKVKTLLSSEPKTVKDDYEKDEKDEKDEDKMEMGEEGEGETSELGGLDLGSLYEQLRDRLDLAIPEGIDLTSPAGVAMLVTAALNKIPAAEVEEEELEPEPVEESPPMQMSSEQKRALSSAQAATAWAENEHRKQLRSRITSLKSTGRCTPIEAQRHESKIGGVKLSLVGGKPKSSDTERWIESREAIPKGTFFTAEQKTKLSSVEDNSRFVGGDEMTPERANELAAKILKRGKTTRVVK